ncbi:MAG: hypothetical protein ACREHV_13645 [Rhizomicrobium sp.]
MTDEAPPLAPPERAYLGLLFIDQSLEMVEALLHGLAGMMVVVRRSSFSLRLGKTRP